MRARLLSAPEECRRKVHTAQVKYQWVSVQVHFRIPCYSYFTYLSRHGIDVTPITDPNPDPTDPNSNPTLQPRNSVTRCRCSICYC